MKKIIPILLTTFILNFGYSQTAEKFNTIYGKDSEFLFFKNGKMKLIKFYSDAIELNSQYDFKISDNKISYGTSSTLTISNKGAINESIEFEGLQLYKRGNFIQLYTSLGYNSDDIAFKFGIYPLNDWTFCEYFDITHNLNDPFDFVRQYMHNNKNYIQAKEEDKNERLIEMDEKYQKEKIEREEKEFDDSVRTNTFPKYIGQLSSFGGRYGDSKQFEAFFIDKKGNGELKAQWINEDKRITNFDAVVRDYGVHLKKFAEVPVYPELKEKIETLMSNKEKGFYYLSFYVNAGKEETSKGVYNDVKKIDVDEFYKGNYNEPKQTYRENQIQYSIVCDNCNVRYSDKHASGIIAGASNVNSSWTYYFNSPKELNKYLSNPHDFFRPIMYGHSGQYVYISAKANKGGSVTVKIIRDGIVWKETTSSGENAIATISGFLP